MTAERTWWRDGVLYQLYPRSFADSDGDGVGDLRGVVERLDYLQWLGIDGVWLNPITASPDDDWGYDVADYCAVHPALGDLDAADDLVARAGERGIRILLDLVPNHTSSRHPWFVDALTGRGARHRDWYVWADPKPGGSPPNNWRSVFGGPAWTLDDASGQYYLHNFLPTQPDLNWWNEDVRAAFDDVLRFWFDRGVAGFRIDVAHAVVKDRDLRDNLPATERDHPSVQRFGQQHTFNMDQPEVHDVIRRWRKIADSYDPPRVLVGETFLYDLERVARYYGRGDELHLAFNFPFALSELDAATMRAAVELTERVLPDDAWPVWMGSNHDIGRFPTRWCGDDDAKTRAALVVLLTLRGTPFLYYGDEIGMTNVDVPHDRLVDPVAHRSGPGDGRDPARTPMQWSAAPNAGFTTPEARPWLPVGGGADVASQRDDPGSTLTLTRALIALRKRSRDLASGAYRTMRSPDGTWAFRRGDATAVAVNLSPAAAPVDGIHGIVAVATDEGRAGERVSGTVELRPWEGLVVTPDG
ncbi:MAG TPA: alpha-amylase family glycosyl hydrolase [Actinomycetota bacterium]|nr:alpha-amylase family glycosyl hydrolase [Actinomycetota bacterium]